MSTYVDRVYPEPRHVHITFLETVQFSRLTIVVDHKELLCEIVAEHITMEQFTHREKKMNFEHVATFTEIPEGFSVELNNVVSLCVVAENHDDIMETLHKVTVIQRVK